jgi:hypothetical protein
MDRLNRISFKVWQAFFFGVGVDIDKLILKLTWESAGRITKTIL